MLMMNPGCKIPSDRSYNIHNTYQLTGEYIMKRGLILEGGAMRGMFTAGVLDVFMENDIEFDGAIGVSAGAVFGCNISLSRLGEQ